MTRVVGNGLSCAPATAATKKNIVADKAAIDLDMLCAFAGL
jgi:hypothetical protein